MGTGEPREQPVERPGGRPEERLRDAGRRRHADAVAVARHVLHRDPALLAADPRPDGAARRGQLGEVQRCLGPAADRAVAHLVGREVAEAAKEVVDLVRVVRLPLLDERLEAELEVRERLRVEQLAQLLLAQQLAQQVAVEGQRLRPALGERRVALVHVGGDVVEQQRAREGGGAGGLDAVDRDLAAPDAVEDLAQGRQVEHVGQALAVGLDEDREAPVARGDREQVGRRAGAAATAGSASRAGAAAAGAPAPRSPGSGWRTGSTARPARPPGPRPPRDRGTAAPRRRRGSIRRPAAGSRCRRRTRSSGPRARVARTASPRAPSSTGRGPGRRTASARRAASRRARRGSARRRSAGPSGRTPVAPRSSSR